MRPMHWLFALVGACSIHLAMAYAFAYHGATAVDTAIGADEIGVRIQLGMQGASLTPEAMELPEVDMPAQADPEPPTPTAPVKAPERTVKAPEPEARQPVLDIEPVIVSVAKVAPPANAVLIQMDDQPRDTNTAPPHSPSQPENPQRPTLAKASRRLENSPESGARRPQSTLQTTAYSTAKNNYFARLMGTLQRSKRYPKEAKKKKQQGTVLLQFSINKSGDVVAANIVASSGHALLDEAALQMLRKASPLPSIPDSLTQQNLEITIPVEYSLITK